MTFIVFDMLLYFRLIPSMVLKLPILIAATCCLVFTALIGQAQTSRVQLIHNSPDSALTQVDIWVDTVRVADNLVFRRATAFLDLSFGTHTLSVTHMNSTDTSNAILKDTFHFGLDTSYVAVLAGLVSAGYTANQPLALHCFDLAHEQAASSGNTDVLFFQGTPDLPTVDLVEITEIGAPLVSNFAFGEFDGYQELESIHYRLSLERSSTQAVLREYDLLFASEGLEDSAIVVVTSGFLHPDSNNSGPGYGLFYALPEGGQLLAFPVSTAQLQVIHNSADPSLSSLDVYTNHVTFFGDLAFRQATIYSGVPSGVDVVLSVAVAGSTGAQDSLHSETVVLEANTDYIAVINGLNDGTISPFEPLDLLLFESKREASLGYNTDVTLIHGSTDAPTLVVDETAALGTTIFGPLPYGAREDYVDLPSAQYEIKLLPSGSGESIRSYVANLESEEYKGKALTWLVSGFDSDNLTDTTLEVGIWVSTAEGGPLVELERATGLPIAPDINNYIFPNPVNNRVHIDPSLRVESISLLDGSGRLVRSVSGPVSGMEVSDLASGIYTLHLQSDRGYSVHKLMVAH